MKALTSLAALIGVLLYVVAVGGRFYNQPSVLGFDAINVFNVGTGFLVVAIYIKLSLK